MICWLLIELEDDKTKDLLTFDFSHWIGEVKGDIRKEMPVMRLGKTNKQSKMCIHV
jgi:hypothetical protein